MKFKVKIWNSIFWMLLILNMTYLIFSAIPPTVLFGVYVGSICSIFCLIFVVYTQYLIKHGKGDELRP